MNIVCPSEVIMNTWRTRPPYVLTLHENLWLVDKAGYDKCEVNEEGKLLLVCNNPGKPKKFQFSFHPTYSSEEPRFAPGRHYYFISKFQCYSSFSNTQFVQSKILPCGPHFNDRRRTSCM